MVTELLVTKIREKIKEGNGEAVIKSSLLSEGWPLDDINEVLKIEYKGEVKNVVKGPKNDLFLYLGLTLLGIIISLWGAFGIMKLMSGREDKNNNPTQQNTTTEPSITSKVSVVVSPSVAPALVAVGQANFLALTDYIDSKDKYKIRPPKDWTIDTTGKLGAPVFFFGPNSVGDGNFVYKPNISILTGPANNNTVEGYADFYLKNVSSKLDKFVEIEKRTFNVSGRNVVIIRDTFDSKGQSFSGTTLLLVDKDKVYVVSGMALTSKYKDVKEAMDLSIYSFDLL